MVSDVASPISRTRIVGSSRIVASDSGDASRAGERFIEHAPAMKGTGASANASNAISTA